MTTVTNGPLAIVQSVVANAGNSSTTNLAAGNSYTFTGTAASTLGVAGIQVSLFADKNCIIKVQQSPDSTPHWDLIDTYYYTASSNFGVTVQAISSYVRVVVTTASETTGTFRLQTALCPIVEAVPRSLDGNGNFKVAAPTDSYGFAAENTPFGEQRVIEPVRLVGAVFDGYVIDANFWTTSATGTGAAIAQGGSQLTITSGTGSGATVSAYSNRKGRYVGGAGLRYRAVIQNAAGTANNVRRWGVVTVANYNFTISAGTAAVGNIYTVNSQQFTCLQVVSPTSIQCYGTGAPSASGTLTFISGPGAGNLTYTAFAAQAVPMDGAYFKLDNTTLSVNTMLGATETPVTVFNGQLGSTYAIGTGVKTYEIYWTNSKVIFAIGDILHTVSASSAPFANTMTFHVFMDSINSGVASSVTMGIRTATIYRLGKPETRPFWKYESGNVTAGILKRGPGTLHRVVNTDSTGALLLYDAGSATNQIAAIDCTKVFGPMDFDLDFYNGLCYTTTGGPKVTIVYE